MDIEVANVFTSHAKIAVMKMSGDQVVGKIVEVEETYMMMLLENSPHRNYSIVFYDKVESIDFVGEPEDY